MEKENGLEFGKFRFQATGIAAAWDKNTGMWWFSMDSICKIAKEPRININDYISEIVSVDGSICPAVSTSGVFKWIQTSKLKYKTKQDFLWWLHDFAMDEEGWKSAKKAKARKSKFENDKNNCVHIISGEE